MASLSLKKIILRGVYTLIGLGVFAVIAWLIAASIFGVEFNV